jgi:hypothetical protein
MNYRYLTLLALAAWLPGPLPAQSDSADEATPMYDVEVVIFKNVKAPKSREYILPVSSPNRDDKMLDLSSASSLAAAARLGYTRLPKDELRLLETVAKLKESPRYEMLSHVAWRQPGVEREKALPIWLRGGRIYGSEYTSIDNQIEFLESIPRIEGAETGGNKNFAFDEQTLEALELQMLEQQALRVHQGLYEFEGKITVALSRYLHVFTDLVFRRPRLSVDPVTSNTPQDQYLAAYAADTRILNNHSLREHRRMRSKNLHYLDNPEFAMLILITPYEAPQETAPPETETTPPASE